jgi:hypothetical protein
MWLAVSVPIGQLRNGGQNLFALFHLFGDEQWPYKC